MTSAAASGTTLPLVDPSYFGGLGRRYESGVNLSLVRNTVDNPYQSRSGMRHTLGLQYVGGPLGGTVDYIRPTWESVVYVPFGREWFPYFMRRLAERPANIVFILGNVLKEVTRKS